MGEEDFSSTWFCTDMYLEFFAPVCSYMRYVLYFIFMQIITIITRETAAINMRVEASQEQALIYDQQTSVQCRNTTINSDMSIMNVSISARFADKRLRQSKSHNFVIGSKESSQVDLVTMIISNKMQNND